MLAIYHKGRSVSTWAFSNVGLLKQNHELIEKRFLTSAELISNLSNPEQAEKINNLDSDDPIGKALQSIKTEMQRIKVADEHKEWIAQGLASFSEVLSNKMEARGVWTPNYQHPCKVS